MGLQNKGFRSWSFRSSGDQRSQIPNPRVGLVDPAWGLADCGAVWCRFADAGKQEVAPKAQVFGFKAPGFRIETAFIGVVRP